MTLEQKRWLVGKLETQAPYGTKVRVVANYSSAWLKVVVPDQPTPRDKRGYPGFVPAVQLTGTAPVSATTMAIVKSPTAWVWSRWSARGVTGRKLMEISFDTRLPLVRATNSYAVVKLLGGRSVALKRGTVALYTAGQAWHPTRAALVADAKKFLRLGYLWGGTSGFGYDCSGFSYSVYHAEGVVIPRDAGPQSTAGRPVNRSALLPADLVFFRSRSGGPVVHVGLYIGDGHMIDAPHTGSSVRVEPVTASPYYAGARRFVQ